MSYKDFFKRVLLNVRERPNSGDHNRLQTRLNETARLVAHAVMGESFGSSTTLLPSLRSTMSPPLGFVGTGFQVSANSGAAPYGLKIESGIGFAPVFQAGGSDLAGINGLDYSPDTWAPVVLSATQTGIAVPSVPSAGHSRIDIIEVRSNYSYDEPATVGIFNPTTEVFDPTVKNKSFDWDLLGLTGSVTSPTASTAAISYKIGADYTGGIAGATEPSVTPGYMKIARINLDGAVVSITDSLIADLRRPIFAGGMVHAAGQLLIPGKATGLGTESFQEASLPPGVFMKAMFDNSTAPTAGESYEVTIALFGGDLRPRTSNIITIGGTDYNVRGAAVATALGATRRCMVIGTPYVGQVNAAFQSILDGTDANWTVINGVATIPLGTPFALFTVRVTHASASALSDTEKFAFQYTLSLA